MSAKEPHTGHEQHICFMVEKDVPGEKLRSLVKDAKYICSCFGRAAAKAENLCAPESL